jgi:hypothetical protein
MQSYYDVVTDSGNRPIAGAQVFVYNYDGTLATLYGDQALLSTTVLASNGTPYIVNQDLLSPQANPIVTGADGKFLFFAANGVYSVVITADNYDTRTLVATLNDPTPPAPSVSPYVTFDLSSAAPNTTVNAVSMTPSTATTNVDLVLAPKGTGALIVNVPTDLIPGGEKRGSYAVDLQRDRILSYYVASGATSVISGGSNNTASGDSSVVSGGSTNAATANFSSVSGGSLNSAIGTYAGVSSGLENVAQGQYAAISGGRLNSALGNNSFVGSGQSNQAQESHSVVVGGLNNIADSTHSAIIGGAYGSTRGVVGYQAFPACLNPIQTKVGVSQGGLLILGAVTTTATPTILRSNTSAAGAANQLILPNNSAYYVFGYAIANVTGAGDTKSWIMSATIKRGSLASSTTVVGSLVASQQGDAGASTWDIALTADTTNGGLQVTVTGQASTVIRWVCKLETTEVAY